jgi:hypothetical protein
MRYRLFHYGVDDYFDILAEETSIVVGTVYLTDPGYRIVREAEPERKEVAIVSSIDQALPVFAAHVSTHPRQWARTGLMEYKKDTDYGETLRVQQNSVGDWRTFREDCELGDNNGPVTFPTALQAQRAADLHRHDGSNSVCPGDNLSWLGWMDDNRYFCEHRFGEAVAAAIGTKSRARREYGTGGIQPATQDMIEGQIVRLHAISLSSVTGKSRTRLPVA